MSDHDEPIAFEELSLGDQPIAVPEQLPILPLRDTVLFPNSFMPLAVARESSVRLIDEALSAGKLIGVFTQRDAQDVQAARRQPPADRAGPRPAHAR
jgi:ATP-dependent Lon protease